MITEAYILKLRFLSVFRWIKELGFIRILLAIVLLTAGYKFLYNGNNTIAGVSAIIFLNMYIIGTVHFLRKDGFFLDLLCVNKKFLFFTEYLIYSLPFLSMLVLSKFFYFGGITLLFLIGIIFIKSGQGFVLKLSSKKSLFPSYAFEFISGVRKNFFYLLVIYAVGIVFSYQLAGGIISVMMLTVVFTSFFIENEPLLMIEAYRMQPKKFILTKIFQSLKIFLAVIAPIVILNLVFFYERWYFISGIVFICLLIIISSVLTKYAFYSEEFSSAKMNYLVTGIIIFSFGSSFFMTGPLLFPLPFAMMIYLYQKSVKNVSTIRNINF